MIKLLYRLLGLCKNHNYKIHRVYKLIDLKSMNSHTVEYYTCKKCNKEITKEYENY
jgi:hypothetical protein